MVTPHCCTSSSNPVFWQRSCRTSPCWATNCCIMLTDWTLSYRVMIHSEQHHPCSVRQTGRGRLMVNHRCSAHKSQTKPQQIHVHTHAHIYLLLICPFPHHGVSFFPPRCALADFWWQRQMEDWGIAHWHSRRELICMVDAVIMHVYSVLFFL